MTALTKVLIGVAGSALLALGTFAYAMHDAIPAPKVSFAAQEDSGVQFELFRGNRIFVPASINGRETTAVLDSGAGATVVDRAFARAMGLPAGMKVEGRGVGGSVEAELVSGVTLRVGSMTFKDMTVAVMDMEPVARAIGHPITVVIGRELFNSAVVSIDWSASRLRLSAPDRFAPSGDALAVKLGRAEVFHTIPVQVGGSPPIQAMLDLGNGGNLALGKADWSANPELARLPHADGSGGGVGGWHSLRSVILPDVFLGQRRFANVPGELNERGSTAATEMTNVGIGFLKQFNVDLDFGRDRLFLRPRSDAPPFERDRAGVRLELHGDRLGVKFVSPQGPAAAAGLKPGDEIIAVDGRKVTPGYYTSDDWTNGEAGRAVELTRANGTKVQLTLADYY